jgi:NADH-quinone oxidoreductase subunit G
MLKKAGEVTDTKPDFEMMVRIAAAMGFDVHGLVPFGGGTRSDMGQSRGAQSGEADRHAVWLEMQNLEPKMTPFDPLAIFDEIQRVVAGFNISRVNLLAGNDQHLEIADSGGGAKQDAELVVPAHDGLFSSGTLGKYSKTLNSVYENKSADAEVAAD